MWSSHSTGHLELVPQQDLCNACIVCCVLFTTDLLIAVHISERAVSFLMGSLCNSCQWCADTGQEHLSADVSENGRSLPELAASIASTHAALQVRLMFVHYTSYMTCLAQFHKEVRNYPFAHAICTLLVEFLQKPVLLHTTAHPQDTALAAKIRMIVVKANATEGCPYMLTAVARLSALANIALTLVITPLTVAPA